MADIIGEAIYRIVQKMMKAKQDALLVQATEFMRQGFHTEDLTIWNQGNEWGVCPLSYFDAQGKMIQILIPAWKEPKLTLSGKLE